MYADNPQGVRTNSACGQNTVFDWSNPACGQNTDLKVKSEDQNGVINRPVWRINMLSHMNSNLELFGEESVHAFDDWADRFKDYLSLTGKNWSEEEKVTRLKLALKDTPRELFKELQPFQITTFTSALEALRAKLDSPQRREVPKRSLSVCRQRENETVAQFLRRLTPLIDSTNPSLTGDLRKEKICEEFLDRLRPNMSFLIRLVGLTQPKNLEMVKAQAEELEALLLSTGGGVTQITQLINSMTEQRGNEEPNEQNERKFEQQWRDNGGEFRNATSHDAQCSYLENERSEGNHQNWPTRGHGNMNRRNWSNYPTCQLCNRAGHSSYNCHERRAQFENQTNGEWHQHRRRPWNNWRDQPNEMNEMPPSTSSLAPEFMENLVKSLITLNLQKLNNTRPDKGTESQIHFNCSIDQ